MKKSLLIVAVLALALVAAVLMVPTFAADPKPAAGQPAGQMPPMGPPAEMKGLAGMVGTWNYTMKMKMDPSSDQFQEMKMTCKMAYILDGAALTQEHESVDLMNGMKFKGIGIQTYDRELKQWQMTWTDNMSGRTGIYTGQITGDSAVFTGEDLMMGQKFLSRITMSKMTPTSFDWKMEMSMDQGKTWMVSATSSFAKSK